MAQSLPGWKEDPELWNPWSDFGKQAHWARRWLHQLVPLQTAEARGLSSQHPELPCPRPAPAPTQCRRRGKALVVVPPEHRILFLGGTWETGWIEKELGCLSKGLWGGERTAFSPGRGASLCAGCGPRLQLGRLGEGGAVSVSASRQRFGGYLSLWAESGLQPRACAVLEGWRRWGPVQSELSARTGPDWRREARTGECCCTARTHLRWAALPRSGARGAARGGGAVAGADGGRAASPRRRRGGRASRGAGGRTRPLPARLACPLALGRAAGQAWEPSAPSRCPHLSEPREEPLPRRAARRGWVRVRPGRTPGVGERGEGRSGTKGGCARGGVTAWGTGDVARASLGARDLGPPAWRSCAETQELLGTWIHALSPVKWMGIHAILDAGWEWRKLALGKLFCGWRVVTP